MFLKVFKIISIITVQQHVLGYPLAVWPMRPIGAIMPSLRSYTCHFGVLIKQINLQPLLTVFWLSWPPSRFSTSLFKVQSSLSGGMIIVSFRRCADLWVWDFSAFHSESVSFCAFCKSIHMDWMTFLKGCSWTWKLLSLHNQIFIGLNVFSERALFTLCSPYVVPMNINAMTVKLAQLIVNTNKLSLREWWRYVNGKKKCHDMQWVN